MPNVGPMELLWLALLGLLLFGPKRLPEIGRSLGNAMREFRDSVSAPAADSAEAADADQPPET